MTHDLIDTHAHLYVEQFDTDRNDVVRRAFDSGVEKIYLPNIDESSIEGMYQLVDLFPDRIFPMMGLHPCSVQADFMAVLDRMESLLVKRVHAGIGETGIDLYWDTSTRDWQIASFERQIGWASDYQLPLIIHSRSALDITIALIEKNVSPQLSGIFHCFDGTYEQAKRILDTGFYLGIGGVVTYKKSEIIQVLKKIGLERVVLETDAPYLSPVPKRGRRNESAYISYVADFISTAMEMPQSDVYRMTSNNAKAIFDK